MKFKENIVEEIALNTTRSYPREVAFKDFFYTLFDAANTLHEEVFALAEENWLETASYESLVRLAGFFKIYDPGIDPSWLSKGISFKVRARHYNYKLFGPFGLLNLCKYATDATTLEYVPIKGRVSIVYCYVPYEITKNKVAFLTSLMESLKVVGVKTSVYICHINNFAADETRDFSAEPSPGEDGDLCYKIL